jgi:hypothetical protein
MADARLLRGTPNGGGWDTTGQQRALSDHRARHYSAQINDPAIPFWHSVRMPGEYNLTLRQADQARADFSAIEDDLKFIMDQLARIPTRREQARNALAIILTTAMLTTLAVCGSPAIGATAYDESWRDHRGNNRCDRLDTARSQSIR